MKKFLLKAVKNKYVWITAVLLLLLLIIRIQCSCNRHFVNKYKDTKIEKKY